MLRSLTLHRAQAAWRALHQVIPFPLGSSGSAAVTGSHFLKGKGLRWQQAAAHCSQTKTLFFGDPVQGKLRYVLHCQWLFTREPCSGFNRKGVGHRQPCIAVYSYLASVLLVQVEAYFLPCTLDAKSIRRSSYKRHLTSKQDDSSVSTCTVFQVCC